MARASVVKDQALGTKERALQEARRLLQSQGFNGFSFQDIADIVGVKKPSLYDHFASKEELGLELIRRYRQEFSAWTEVVAGFEPVSQVEALFDLYFKFASRERRQCPLMALTAEINTLPASMQKALIQSGAEQMKWLEGVIARGQKEKRIRRDLTAAKLASSVLAMGYGAQAVARVSGDAQSVRLIGKTATRFLVG